MTGKKDQKIQSVINLELYDELLKMAQEDQMGSVGEEIRYLIINRRDKDRLIAEVEARLALRLPALIDKHLSAKLTTPEIQEVLKPVVSKLVQDTLF